MPPRARILTHCNAGALATAGYGTALGIVRSAHAQGKVALLWVDETRPVMQGSRLTAWECVRDGIPHRLIADVGGRLGDGARARSIWWSPAPTVSPPTATPPTRSARMRWRCWRVTTGCRSTSPRRSRPSIRRCRRGPQIPIEERDALEVRRVGAQVTAPEASPVFNPAFDVTPAELISAIVTERGVFRPPYQFSGEGLSTLPTVPRA